MAFKRPAFYYLKVLEQVNCQRIIPCLIIVLKLGLLLHHLLRLNDHLGLIHFIQNSWFSGRKTTILKVIRASERKEKIFNIVLEFTKFVSHVSFNFSLHILSFLIALNYLFKFFVNFSKNIF